MPEQDGKRPRDPGGAKGRILRDQVWRDDHQGTLVWLDGSLGWVRSRGQTRLSKLLNLVRIELLFDADFREGRSSIRNRPATDGPAPGANRRIPLPATFNGAAGTLPRPERNA